jgi:hypothetical protein
MADVVAVERSDASAFVESRAGLDGTVAGITKCGGVGDRDGLLGIASSCAFG